ncbi:MAG: hypothetical protein WBJ87_08500, partial [Candidatus Hydrothermia bacterium]
MIAAGIKEIYLYNPNTTPNWNNPANLFGLGYRTGKGGLNIEPKNTIKTHIGREVPTGWIGVKAEFETLQMNYNFVKFLFERINNTGGIGCSIVPIYCPVDNSFISSAEGGLYHFEQLGLDLEFNFGMKENIVKLQMERDIFADEIECSGTFPYKAGKFPFYDASSIVTRSLINVIEPNSPELSNFSLSIKTNSQKTAQNFSVTKMFDFELVQEYEFAISDCFEPAGGIFPQDTNITISAYNGNSLLFT